MELTTRYLADEISRRGVMSWARPGHGSRARLGEEDSGKAREKTSNEGRVRCGEPGRQQLHHGFRDHELFVLGSRETRVTRIGFRKMS
jgi:hypothetical protein